MPVVSISLCVSLSFCHLFPTSSATSLVNVILIFNWIAATSLLVLCFAVLLLPMRLPIPFIHLQITLPKVYLQDRAHTLHCVFLDSPFSYRIPIAIIPTRHSDTYNIDELARLFQASASWPILFLCLEILSFPLLTLRLSLSIFTFKKSLWTQNSYPCLMMGQMQMFIFWNSMKAPSDH